MMHAYTDLNLTQLREEERVKALKRSDSSPNLRGGVASSAGKPFFEAQPFPENIFTDFAEEQMKVWMLLPERSQYRRIICAGAAELPGNPEKITSRSASRKVLLSSKDGVGDDKVVLPLTTNVLFLLLNLKTRISGEVGPLCHVMIELLML